ncbi:zinc-binding dehydrogenase [Sulfitobacter sp. R86518]|uniref:zinc-binding dehydrogenase n=1 Tax=Sulfitobacter sp. R86518 TaxID=3093858 RepID=UPI0036DB72BF
MISIIRKPGSQSGQLDKSWQSSGRHHAKMTSMKAKTLTAYGDDASFEAAELTKLAEIVDAGALEPLLDDQRVDLDTVGEAYDRPTSARAIGKVVVGV